MGSLRLFAVTALIVLLSGCEEYRITLPNGWILEQWSGGDHVIFKTDTEKRIQNLIGPTVEAYGVVDNVVAGRVAPHLRAEWPPDLPVPKGGYFVVETATGRVWHGLDEAAWRQRLRDLGVTEEPRLQRPTRHDRQYGPQPAAS